MQERDFGHAGPVDMPVDMEVLAGDAGPGQKAKLRLWLRLLSTSRLISNEIRRRLRAEFGATLPQFELMAQLQREPEGLRLGELSRRTMATNGNVTGLADRLEADGLLVRVTPGGDRRVTVARLTPQGMRLFAEIAAAHEAWLSEMTGDVGPDACESLVREIGKLKSSVVSHISELAPD